MELSNEENRNLCLLAHPHSVPVVSDPAQLGAVFVCHDAFPWHSMPPLMPRVRAYVAVDRNCRDRMVLVKRLRAR